MLNKPAGVVCAVRYRLTPTVLELLPAEYRRQGLFPAGILDKDTEGFVLITDDGDLAHKMLSPASHVPKRYFVRLRYEISPEAEKRFAEGIEIDGGELCKPAFLERTENPCECFLTICEEKYHQVKRMFSAVGNSVVYLRRDRIGKLDLDAKLGVGKARFLTDFEIHELLCK